MAMSSSQVGWSLDCVVIGSFTAKRDVKSSPSIARWLWQLPLLGLLIYALRNPYDDASIIERAFFHFGPGDSAGCGPAHLVNRCSGFAFALSGAIPLGTHLGLKYERRSCADNQRSLRHMSATRSMPARCSGSSAVH